MQSRVFGRRPGPQAAAPRPEPSRPDRLAAPAPHPATPEVDEELEACKRARRRKLPWRQIYLMASLSFGIASFVLPDSVNAAVDWLLWGLAAAGLIAWWRG